MPGRRPRPLAAVSIESIESIASIAVALVMAIVSGASIDAQQGPSPSSTISGTVIDGVTHAPMPHAHVEARPPGGASHQSSSDADGHYAIAGLVPGNYRVTASATGAFTGEFGQETYSGSGRLVLAEADEVRSDVVVPVWPAAAIQGRIADTGGAAAAAHVVLIKRSDDWDQMWTALRPDPVSTDGEGRYRFEGLEPGRYGVLAWPATGTHTSGFAPTFAPATTRGVDLVPIDVAPGERRDADVDVRPRSVITIGGHLLGAADQISGTVVRACSTDAVVRALGACIGETRASDDGSFRIAGVPAGNYALEAQRPRADRPGVLAWGRRAVSLGASVDNADIQMNRPFALSGVATADNPGENVSGATIAVRAVDALLVPLDGRPASDPIDATAGSGGRFIIEDLPPGEYVYCDRPGIGPWTLLSAIAGSRDAADEPISLDEGVEPPAAAVTLTRASARVAGVVRSASGEPEVDAVVLLFSTEPHVWLLNSRRVQAGRTGAGGAFSFDAVPPGEYYVAAETRPAPPLIRATLEGAVAFSRKIQVGAGARVQVDLTLAVR